MVGLAKNIASSRGSPASSSSETTRPCALVHIPSRWASDSAGSAAAAGMLLVSQQEGVAAGEVAAARKHQQAPYRLHGGSFAGVRAQRNPSCGEVKAPRMEARMANRL